MDIVQFQHLYEMMQLSKWKNSSESGNSEFSAEPLVYFILVFAYH